MYNSQKLETIQIHINMWINKYIVVYPYNGIPLHNKK